ncbi:MAG: hypothetical protein A2571_03310 [Candidatus Vogelbacteria bacterium RIFOXYD1_FULL_44_32]|uniref:Uncharacterized protein n=1 Tax=Candidatus Vogelbacteria bacterium RIFOXYD1_FULL_44_32 TaxID=1802438 RepID=A0A1G2QCU2_9BACT|nr:MAG: hypothetical protein A2571_03310 [Candidatus Vogelbacteria bacterium RIFOXYD1_FULL_44_32]
MPLKEDKYKLYLASGIRLWTLFFKDGYSPYFNKKVSLFEPALIDNQYTGEHRKIPIKIATKDLGEINKCDAVLAYMKMYDTQGNGPTGTDSSWECGYAIGQEKPTIMLVEDLEHLDYYTSQWMVTFSIGAILTTDKEVAESARHSDKFTHTAILLCENKEQFEDKIIEYLDKYYRSIYAREGEINYSVDQEIRKYVDEKNLQEFFEECQSGIPVEDKPTTWYYDKKTKYNDPTTYLAVCTSEVERAGRLENIIENNFNDLPQVLKSEIGQLLEQMENDGASHVAEMASYWLNIPAAKVKDRRQGKKKTRPTIFYELFDLVSHHIVASERYFEADFVYKAGAVIEIYNWLNTYAIDDVFDSSATRQGESTLHEKYGSRRNALLVGGIGHCLALYLLYELTKKQPEAAKDLLSSLNNVQKLMYLGQPHDIALTFDSRWQLKSFIKKNSLDTALQLYFKRIYGICGAFYEEIGRMAMKATNVGAQFYDQEEVEEACVSIARQFGLVQMIRNDLGDFITAADMPGMSKGMKDTSHNDIAEGKLTLPVIYTLFSPEVSTRDKKIVIRALGNRRLKDSARAEISRIIWESGAIEFSLQFIDYYVRAVRRQYVRHINETPTRLKWILKLMDITPLIDISFRRVALDRKWRKLEPLPFSDDMVGELDKLAERGNFLESRK